MQFWGTTRGELPAFAEYDLLHGLIGIGAHFLQHAPGRILACLVTLSSPKPCAETSPWTGTEEISNAMPHVPKLLFWLPPSRFRPALRMPQRQVQLHLRIDVSRTGPAAEAANLGHAQADDH
ncbi:hypothetical protein GCM10010176_026300 [Nonomuraea spiralis]|nr:hypothetical protein GCM10010176_026300 [Nonomuraea spiralis]